MKAISKRSVQHRNAEARRHREKNNNSLPIEIPNCSIIRRKLSACKKSLTKKEMDAMNAFVYFLSMKEVYKHLNIKQKECDKLLSGALKKLERIYAV